MNDTTHMNDEGARLCSESVADVMNDQSQVLVLLRLRTPPANGKNVHIVISKPRGEGSDEFLYNEHCAPENFLGVEIIAEGDDVDPVGVFEYVQTVDMPDDFDSCNVGPEKLAQLFDKFEPFALPGRAQPLPSTAATQPSDSDLLQALRNADRLLRAAGFAMTGTCSSKIVAVINAHAAATQPEQAEPANHRAVLYGCIQQLAGQLRAAQPNNMALELADALLNDRAALAIPASTAPFEPTEQQFADWCERHDMHHTDRDAFYDAASLYLTADSIPASTAASEQQAGADERALGVIDGLKIAAAICNEYDGGWYVYRQGAQECVNAIQTQIGLQQADAHAQLERTERALRRAGFEDLGGEEWKPPIGHPPRFIEVATPREHSNEHAPVDTARIDANGAFTFPLNDNAGQ